MIWKAIAREFSRMAKLGRCEHFWRPAIAAVWEAENRGRINKPAKVCDDCGQQVILSVPEFYAQFGRMPW